MCSGESLLNAYALMTIGWTKYAQYVTLEKGYKQVAERNLLRKPPLPVEQAITIQASAIAQAEWLREL